MGDGDGNQAGRVERAAFCQLRCKRRIVFG
jgi:hypothetical protein